MEFGFEIETFSAQTRSRLTLLLLSSFLALSSFILPILLPPLIVLAFYPLLSQPPPTPTRSSPSPNWGSSLYASLSPICPRNTSTKPYSTALRTGFVSFPRSGNSYLRSLVERVTGFQTSSVYCDRSLVGGFKGECNHTNGFFVKVSLELRETGGWES